MPRVPAERPSVPQLFLAALKLGCTSFGGPVAHLGYFHRDYVERRRWIGEAQYADLVALCQFLPGPASSQVGFGVGVLNRGLAGGIACWLGFTLPSAALLTGFAYGINALGQLTHAGWLDGLKVAAVAVVAQAVVAMWRSLCPDWPRSAVAALIGGLVLLATDAWSQVEGLVLGAAIGGLALKSPRATPTAGEDPRGGRGTAWLAVFAALLLLLPVAVRIYPNGSLRVADCFYRVGALVFGGGHAVLPLLERELVGPGWLTHDQFLAGYGATQAVPGPLFTFAAYLGALLHVGPGGWIGAAWAVFWVFLPGLILVLGALPWWQRLRQLNSAQSALRGANAAVVGVLLAALINPVALSGVTGWRHAVLAVAGFAALQFLRLPAWLLVLASAGAGALFL